MFRRKKKDTFSNMVAIDTNINFMTCFSSFFFSTHYFSPNLSKVTRKAIP